MKWHYRRGWLVALSLLALVSLTFVSGAAAGRQAGPPPELPPLLQRFADAEPDATLRVIVRQGPGAADLDSTVPLFGGRVLNSFPSIEAVQVELPARRLEALARLPGVTGVTYDAPVRFAFDPDQVATAYPFSAGAEAAWAAGLSGAGVTVAVIDTGLSPAGPRGAGGDFAGRLLAEVSTHPLNRDTRDRFGHGTHVAGIIGGDGHLSGGRYVGVAPGAGLAVIKAGTDLGHATEGHLIQGLDWVYHNREAYGIRVVNLSATSTVPQPCATSPLCAAVEKLWQAGVVVVVAAGNSGDDYDGVLYPPANSPLAITVGAISDAGTRDQSDDFGVGWSAAGPTEAGWPKPDVLAPGSRIVAPLTGDQSLIARRYPQNVVDAYYLRLGGTSMAAAVVSGVVALMLEADPALTPDQVKWILTRTARPYAGGEPGGPGIVDAGAAAAYSATARPGSANQGPAPQPVDSAPGRPARRQSAHWQTAYWQTAYWQSAFLQSVDALAEQ